MDKNKKLRRITVLIFCAAVILLPPILYYRLMVSGAEGAYMYGNDRFFWVGVVSVLGGAGVLLLFRKGSAEKEELPEETEEEFQPEEQERPTVDTSIAMEEYPELFSKKEETENEIAYAPSYYEALSAALNAQKAEYTANESEDFEKADEIDEIESFLSVKKEEESESEDWFDLPDTLPEGYTAYEEALEEEEKDEETEFEEISENCETAPRGSFARVLKRVLIAVLLVLLPLGFAVFASRFRTDYYADGVRVSRISGVKSYAWEDCESYVLAPSFSGDQLSFVLEMKDGATVELLPSDGLVIGDSFDSEYEYAAYVEAILDSNGAEKHVRERNTIENSFADSDTAGEYVRKLID